MITKTYTIAIDFDGTLVENNYPKIGKQILMFRCTLVKPLGGSGGELQKMINVFKIIEI